MCICQANQTIKKLTLLGVCSTNNTIVFKCGKSIQKQLTGNGKPETNRLNNTVNFKRDVAIQNLIRHLIRTLIRHLFRSLKRQKFLINSNLKFQVVNRFRKWLSLEKGIVNKHRGTQEGQAIITAPNSFHEL